MADETVSGGKETQDPQARVGHLYSEGPNPYPGGQVDTGDTPLPPYDSIRSKGPNTSETTRARTEGVERMLENTVSQGEAEIGQTVSPGGENIHPETGEPLGAISPDEISHRTPDDPHGVGQSQTRRGEDVKKQEGTEAGRHDLGTKGPTNRPYGTADIRDSNPDIDPEGNQPIDEEMQNTTGSGTAAGI
jgi:hypothetical protein